MDAQGLFDTALVRRNRLRALVHAPEGSDFLLKLVNAELSERLAAVERRFETAIALHALDDQLAVLLAASGKVERLIRVEQDQRMLDGQSETALATDLELFPIAAEAAGLVVSPLSLHLVNDLPGLLVQIRQALRPDGLLLAAMPGSGTLSELRDALITAETELSGGVSPRVIPFTDVRDCGALLQRAGFALPVVDAETYTVRYDTMFALMRDLRHMGMANPLCARSRKPATRALFVRAAQIYADRYSDPDGRIRASFCVLYLSGWKPHESQQKPLSPGSAKASLAAALGTREHKF
ncbi:methyltransferase domain-containing protein [Hoeflea poritis]|uniref:Methyltransferase domain-containing protein n=1 Tax=Hoeflea poritis TaxID=2993659 RepID=A0ABT4VMJ9_9HYPH|nr:methyltransferase domain-containing protein [Hoeflea poritis]MDA4845844.1 methyltransferase domain-containing protein [Hoeflea poritis]